MCKVCNGDKLHYESFEELPQELVEKFKPTKITKQTKDGFLVFINKLNERGDELIGNYIANKTETLIKFGKCGHMPLRGLKPDKYKKNGCPICSGKRVEVGINDIATTHTHLIKYFANIEDTIKYTAWSGKVVELKCPCCGKIKNKKVRIETLTTQGFSCEFCGDGISYPEKLMFLVLKALGIDFTRQLTYDNGKHKYDFYIALWKAIFETHGMQHYEGWGHDKEDLIRQQNNDKYKRNDAINNHGILKENYHEIDCRHSTLEWCRPNIEKALSKYVNVSVLTDEDWKEFDKQAQTSLRMSVCEYWKEEREINKDLTVRNIAKKFSISIDSVRNYLKWGNENGFCEYNSKKEIENRTQRFSKFVYLIRPNGEKWFDKSMSQCELSRVTGISNSTLANSQKNKKCLEVHHSAKYNPKYIGSYVVLASEYDAQNN